MKMIVPFLLSLFLLLPLPAQSDIISVSLRWNPIICLKTCQDNLELLLRRIPAVKDVRLNGPAGNAELYWRPGVPYDWQPINYAMRSIGLSILDMHMKAQGLVVQGSDGFNGTNFYLDTGNGTKVQLFSQIPDSKINMVARNSIFAFSLDESAKKKLLTAQANGLQVYAEGQLLLPYRYLNPVLIIANLKIIPPKETK